MKRKRKNACPSPLLDYSLKRTKVHAQRKFAQGSNVNSPVITPIKELETDIPTIEALPEPVELLPIKRPNTEDFLTFLCFRGTPILPPNLNFFNTASIVDTNGQVHEIKSESPKNGPIDIAKCGNSSEKPFIAFGVRKRADPIVISKQMDRKRRHALALQALRRKYQEQKMAKIRALAISKLSEKVTNKTLVRTNTVSKTETVTKKSSTLQKTKVVATKHIKVTTQTLKTTLRPKINQKMCLRSFRGRFIQKELPFRKKIVCVPEKKIGRSLPRKVETLRKKQIVSEKKIESSAEEMPKQEKVKPSVSTPKIVKKSTLESSANVSSRTMRSGIVHKAVTERMKQKRLLISNPKPHVKSRPLRSTTMKKTVLSRKKSRIQTQQKLRAQQRKQMLLTTKPDSKYEPKAQEKKVPQKTEVSSEKSKCTEIKRDFKKVTDIKKESSTVDEKNKKQINESIDIRKEISKSTDIKKRNGKVVEIEKNTRVFKNVRRETTKLIDIKKGIKKDSASVKSPDPSPKQQKQGNAKAKDEKNLKDQQQMPNTRMRKRRSSVDEQLSPQSKTKGNTNEIVEIDRTKKKCSAIFKKDELTAKINEKNKKPASSTSVAKEDFAKKVNDVEDNHEKNKKKDYQEEQVDKTKHKKKLFKEEIEPIKNFEKEEPEKPKQKKPSGNKSQGELLKKDIDKEDKEKPRRKFISSDNKTKEELFKKQSIKVEDEKEKQKRNYTSGNTIVDKNNPEIIRTDEVIGSDQTEKPKRKCVTQNIKGDNLPKPTFLKQDEVVSDQDLKKENLVKPETAKVELDDINKESITDNNKSKKQIGIKEDIKIEAIDKKELAKIINEEVKKKDEVPKKTEEISKRKDEIPKKQDETPKRNEEFFKEKDEASKNPDETPKKKEEICKEIDEASKKPVELPKKKEEICKKKDEVSKKPDELPKKKEEICKKKEEASKKPDELPKKDEICKKKDEASKNLDELPKKEEICKKPDELPQKKEGITKKKEDASKKPDELLKKKEEICKKKDEASKKPDELPKKKEEMCKKKDETSKKPDELPKKKEEICKKIDEASKKPDELPKKKEETSKKQDNMSNKNDDISKEIEEVPKKKEEICKKQDELPKKQQEYKKKRYVIKSKDEIIKNLDQTLSKKDDSPKKMGEPSKDETLRKKDDKKLEATKKKEIPPQKKPEISKHKQEIPKKKEEILKSKEPELSPKPQRPSRKTKEAAAIYMEILSHKLVHDSQIDDDNVSIDSFPELPNVKKTEQRENELKAQAKKDDTKIKLKENDSVATESSNTTKKETKMITQKDKAEKIVKQESDEQLKPTTSKATLEARIEKTEELKYKKPESTGVSTQEENLPKKNVEDKNSKRHTRSLASQLSKSELSDGSDQSFHIDIKVSRQKKNTRSRSLIKPMKSSEKQPPPPALPPPPVVRAADDFGFSNSDESTSDINLQALINRVKKKKFSKTKSKKSSNSFSDSDEEPLSKLTNKSVDEQPVGNKSKSKCLNEPESSVKTNTLITEDTKIDTTKPKRECAKRPQNYLPMFSSSDDEDIFIGFDEKEDKADPVPSKTCTHARPLLDFFTKDIGRRFGKEKINMSNEQIEKWLTESALAGSSVKKENDEMLKFGEKIPTETTLEINETIDTVKLKSSLLQDELKTESKDNLKNIEGPIKKQSSDLKQNDPVKPQPIDRKLIFRKSKIENIPNVNAFSPENESSVYAFGEENEETISTPFRRPTRRPSSTATSRSEDEFSKNEDSSKSGHFRKPAVKQDETDAIPEVKESSNSFFIPQKPSKSSYSKQQLNVNKKSAEKLLSKSKTTEKVLDSDDFKYKVPSSPSASSSSSAKLYKRQNYKPKMRTNELPSSVYMSDFPKKTDPARLVEAPTFHPTEQEFQDPLEYIERIRHKAEQFGICRIVPPSSFKPECKVSDDMRFTAYNQYVHKMFQRWGPNFKELMAIKKYLETQNINTTHPPWIGGMEIDLPRLYQTVQNLGGLKEVIEKKKWPRVSELMKIPKSAQDRVTKLDDIYCKYLLPYDTLSPAEREKLFDEVETEWAKRESKSLLKAQEKMVNEDGTLEGDSEPEDNETEECITKGRNMALNAFYRIARNTMSMYFKTPEPPAQEVEQEYWNYVMTKQNHICVHSGSIDSGSWGYGFAVSKNSPFARHPWNLKVLTNNSCSLLRSLGPVMGVTVPTLHVGMVFSACCWCRDPHGLPWIEYLHTGASKIWYAIPNCMSDLFHSTMKKLVPNYCRNKELWLPSDTVMVPPSLLVDNNVSLCRTVQDPGQFIIVFPKVFTSSISTGYVVSESVYFAPAYWLKTARNLFDSLRNSSEPSMFSLDRLLLSIANDVRCNPEILRQVVPHVQELCDKEKLIREKLKGFGEMEVEKLAVPEVSKNKKKKLHQAEEGDYECDMCRASLFISVVFDVHNGLTYCLEHAVEMLEVNKIQSAKCKLIVTYDDEDLLAVPTKMKALIDSKLQKKSAK